MNYNVTVNGKVYSVTVEKTGAAPAPLLWPPPWLPLLWLLLPPPPPPLLLPPPLPLLPPPPPRPPWPLVRLP